MDGPAWGAEGQRRAAGGVLRRADPGDRLLRGCQGDDAEPVPLPVRSGRPPLSMHLSLVPSLRLCLHQLCLAPPLRSILISHRFFSALFTVVL